MDIDAVASLARIHLTEEEKEKFSGQLESILRYADRLMSVDVEGVEPSAHAFEIVNMWAEDVVEESFDRRDALANAPEVEDNQFIVPRVVEGD
ncbi:MAG: Asp-tRNA(Asn)/Glu-tRNA(Gln) amidotransferase subunit GatC [Puniceicoccales bacterium]|jgi:aspartyl-tRNA(Asn)/glutamyl-tRNA(Gln) amidotransferase subunit C|nr:Asp-tRNA(Asn)/Glu-tRNA(Gln) amidotransferase subunit GatC [Puniceicoccales bacterium]